jgi:hypothetical protein
MGKPVMRKTILRNMIDRVWAALDTLHLENVLLNVAFREIPHYVFIGTKDLFTVVEGNETYLSPIKCSINTTFLTN